MKKASEKPKEKWLKNKNKKDLKQKENIWKNNTRLKKQQLLLNKQMLKENCLNLERRKDKRTLWRTSVRESGTPQLGEIGSPQLGFLPRSEFFSR